MIFNWHLFTDGGPQGLILDLRHYSMFMGNINDGMGHSLIEAQLSLSGDMQGCLSEQSQQLEGIR